MLHYTLCLAIHLMMEGRVNCYFCSNFMRKCLQTAFVNFGSRSNIITFSHPWCLHHALKKSLAVSNAVAVLIINIICGNLLTQSTITKMASYPYDSGKLVMKFMNMLCHGTGGLGNGCKRAA